ncbi:hypothetical protein VX159_16215 [Dechloromonas sp. ZY10]|uniref:hypothetical protein n=1 Tax=Dechloromonas aquae TaxID=2664436 RepID=UPI003528873A
MNNLPIYVIEVTSQGENRIRFLKQDEAASLREMELDAFIFWRFSGKRRFWVCTYSEADLKRYHLRTTGFVARGDGRFEEYEDGFERADDLVREFGSFCYFLPEYSWGSNGCELLSPKSNLSNIIPTGFATLVTSDLSALAVTSNVSAFLYGYVEVANGIGSAELKAKAIAMGLIDANGELRPY